MLANSKNRSTFVKFVIWCISSGTFFYGSRCRNNVRDPQKWYIFLWSISQQNQTWCTNFIAMLSFWIRLTSLHTCFHGLLSGLEVSDMLLLQFVIFTALSRYQYLDYQVSTYQISILGLHDRQWMFKSKSILSTITCDALQSTINLMCTVVQVAFCQSPIKQTWWRRWWWW